MNNLANDLDNNLLANDTYSGMIRATAVQQFSEPIPTGPAPNPGDFSTAPVVDYPTGGVKPPRQVFPTSPPVSSPPRVNPYLNEEDDGMSTEPVNEEEFPPSPEMPSGGGGYGGGGGGGMPEEEIMEEAVMRKEDCKILNINCKLFYGLVAAAAVGTYFYIKYKK